MLIVWSHDGCHKSKHYNMCPQGKIEGAVLVMAKFDCLIRKVKHCLEALKQIFLVTHQSELGHGTALSFGRPWHYKSLAKRNRIIMVHYLGLGTLLL